MSIEIALGHFPPLLLVPVWKDREEKAGLVAPKWFLHEGGERRAFYTDVHDFPALRNNNLKFDNRGKKRIIILDSPD